MVTLPVDRALKSCYNTHIDSKEHKMKKQIKMNRFAKMREIMAEYGFPLRLVMCGRVENGRFYLTHRTK